MSFYTARIGIAKEEIEKVNEVNEEIEKEIQSLLKELESMLSDEYKNKENWKLLYDLKNKTLDDLRQQNAHCQVDLSDLRNTLSQLMLTKELTPFKKPRMLIHGEFA